MKRSYKWVIPGALLLVTLGLSGCDVEKTEEGALPDVDVEGGNMPEYDVDAPEVDVSTEEKTITVPTIDVQTPADDEPDLDQPDIDEPNVDPVEPDEPVRAPAPTTGTN